MKSHSAWRLIFYCERSYNCIYIFLCQSISVLPRIHTNTHIYIRAQSQPTSTLSDAHAFKPITAHTDLDQQTNMQYTHRVHSTPVNTYCQYKLIVIHTIIVYIYKSIYHNTHIDYITYHTLHILWTLHIYFIIIVCIYYYCF